MIKRLLSKQILSSLEPNKVLILYGPRRVGKTTILQQITEHSKERVKFVDGEDASIQHLLSSKTIQSLKEFADESDLLIVDEAQKIPEIGINLKLIVDHIPNIKVIASGSASFSLAQKVGEPLTGRKKTFQLYPVSLRELTETYGHEHRDTFLKNHLMIFGGYPETFRLNNEKRASYLKEIISSYLFRDLLEMEHIKNAKKLRDLLVLLAFQIGNEVSLSELGNNLELHKDTVFRYLDLLEQAFIIINIRGFSRNLRKEVTKSSRYYFYDIGIRNALINNFNPIHLRDDVGALWENFIVLERLKKQTYEDLSANNYFWRTYDQQEIDWVEERAGKLHGYEIKWKTGKRCIKAPRSWTENYKNATFQCISGENYFEFI